MRKREKGIGTGRRERGAQLLELALVLPLLLVMAAGVVDFAQAWNLRQILVNAARDGARLGASQSPKDLNTTNPKTIQNICQDVAAYLANAHVKTAFMNGTSTDPGAGCSSPTPIANTTSTATNPVPLAWTYYSSGTYGLKIERTVDVSVNSGGTTTDVLSTRVTLNYPYNWALGFDNLLNLLNPGAGSGYAGPISIEVYSLMANSN
jgi:Flp pilus assembly protein TadG